jgi:hypothetical protein
MCFSASSSLITFLIGLTGSFILAKYGNKKYKIDNIITRIFFIFISLIQLMDFFFWIDLTNKNGINHIVTLIGPLLNVGQPLILFFIKYIYFKPQINTFYAILNIGYFLYLLDMYSNFLQKSKIITGISHKHLLWPWIKYANPYLYLILLTINIFYLTNWKYNFLIIIILYLCLFLSCYYFEYNPGELWCFFGAFIPFFICIFSYYI